MREVGFLITAAMLVASAAVAEEGRWHSSLWGEAGEDWDPAGRLSDYSHAGYKSGNEPIPDLAVAANVLDFGAVPDDDGDDTEAFLRAVEETESGAILIPEGRYILTDRVSIRRPGVVLRGEGTGRTVLYFPKGLEEVDPRPATTTGGQTLSGYSWSDGFLGIRGSASHGVITAITEPASRGDTRLVVADAEELSPGMEVMVELVDDEERSLVTYLYAGDPGNISNIPAGQYRPRHIVGIEAVEGNEVMLDRPLWYDVRPGWSPTLRRLDVTVHGSGIESLTVEFPARTYGGHFTEDGYNAITFSNVRDCWARDIEVINSDSGVHSAAWFSTFENFTFRVTDDMVDHRGDHGHHGISIGRTDNLVTGFDFQYRFIHDLTVSVLSAGNVFSNGRGVDLSLDHHKRAPNNNLYTNIDAGAGASLWRSGGGADLGRHCAAWTTFWGIRTEEPVSLRPGWSPEMTTMVGLNLAEEHASDPRVPEVIPPDALYPANLHEAQLERRLGESGE